MKLKPYLALMPLAAALVLSGCGKSEAPTASATAEGAAAPAAPAPGNTGPNAEAAKAMEEQRRAAEAKRLPDLKVPFENYSPVDNARGKDQWLTYLAVAHGEQPTPDEELLSLFSGKYYNEPDVFKKSEIAKVELPRIQEELARYKGQRFYRIDFNKERESGSVVGSAPVSLSQPFNMTGQLFDLGSSSCLENTVYGGSQGVRLQFKPIKPDMCKWKVQDIELAKTVEGLRARNAAHLRGTIYFYVSEVQGGNMVVATVTRMEIEVVDQPHYLQGGNTVTAFEL